MKRLKWLVAGLILAACGPKARTDLFNPTTTGNVPSGDIFQTPPDPTPRPGDLIPPPDPTPRPGDLPLPPPQGEVSGSTCRMMTQSCGRGEEVCCPPLLCREFQCVRNGQTNTPRPS